MNWAQQIWALSEFCTRQHFRLFLHNDHRDIKYQCRQLSAVQNMRKMCFLARILTFESRLSRSPNCAGTKLLNSVRRIGPVLFFSHLQSERWPNHGRTFSIYLCPLSFWLTLSRGVLSMKYVLMLSIQALHGIPCLCTPGIVPCIISFSRQLCYFLMVWP